MQIKLSVRCTGRHSGSLSAGAQREAGGPQWFGCEVRPQQLRERQQQRSKSPLGFAAQVSQESSCHSPAVWAVAPVAAAAAASLCAGMKVKRRASTAPLNLYMAQRGGRTHACCRLGALGHPSVNATPPGGGGGQSAPPPRQQLNQLFPQPECSRGARQPRGNTGPTPQCVETDGARPFGLVCTSSSRSVRVCNCTGCAGTLLLACVCVVKRGEND